jgi:hypothetical protein
MNVSMRSALAPHRHGPFIRNGVQPVIEVPVHTPVRSYCPGDSDETGGLEFPGAATPQACIGASASIRIKLSAWTRERLPLIALPPLTQRFRRERKACSVQQETFIPSREL